jgi:exodeoxyribonuclease VII large subunit
MWSRAAKANGFVPSDGKKVLLFGKPTMYAKRGSYQFSAEKILPIGEGSRAEKLKELKEKLLAEGLFDPKKKRKLPRLPKSIGVVTSPTGAAFRDIINVLTRRAPYIEIILRPTIVQGEAAAPDIVRGIKEMNAFGKIDVLIVGRGGGSEDDLWCFNDEAVVRAVRASKIPVISAVGHEIDTPLTDFAADIRAPTPSAAAEIAAPSSSDLSGYVNDRILRAKKALLRKYEQRKNLCEKLTQRKVPGILERWVSARYQRIDENLTRIEKSLLRRVKTKKSHLEQLEKRLIASGPYSILSRGYSIVRKGDDGAVITDSAMIDKGDELTVIFDKGRAKTVVSSKS